MCQEPMRKHGRTAAGSQRWRCTACSLTTTAPRAASRARTEQAALGEFVAWATSNDPQSKQPGAGRAFRRRVSWCWQVPVPHPPVTGEVFPQVFIDGLYLSGGWTLLVARNPTHVIAWQWAGSESAAAYSALLTPIAPPDLVTTDGAGGALKALHALWPDTPIQRCLIHIHRDTRRDLTRNPITTQGKALLAHSRKLLKITTPDQAATWLAALNDYGTQYHHWLDQRTTAEQDPATAALTGRKWWYTHARTRRAYKRLERLARQGTLFAYLADPTGQPRPTPLERTTNPIEATNHQIRDRLRHHRGASPEHQAIIIDWTLSQLTAQPPTPADALKTWNQNNRRPATRVPTKTTTTHTSPHPTGWGTTPTPEESLWNRRGWAGRPH